LGLIVNHQLSAARHPSSQLERLLGRVPTLPRPVVLLEDGTGSGTVRLAWGARRRFRVPWSPEAAGDLSCLDGLGAERRVYGVAAYELGIPPRAARRAPILEQPLMDFFEPEQEEVLDLGTGHGGRGAEHETIPASGSARLLERSFSQQAFEGAVSRVREHIAAGDVYQVNLAVAERFAVAVDPWDAYRRLRAINPSPWMGFADFGDWQVVSGSPELLVEYRPASGGVRTRPIAGTRKKTGDPLPDAVMRRELVLDQKEQAEHRMLLDLARNDLGRVARYGTVEVTERETIEEYSHVFHLVSEVRATARRGVRCADAIRAVFPGGTITGTPKIRAMEVIADLEPVARGAYTGALGWIGPDGMQLNILIRSAVMRDGEAAVQAGSGIVWDSDPKREWREALRKGEAVRWAVGVSNK